MGIITAEVVFASWIPAGMAMVAAKLSSLWLTSQAGSSRHCGSEFYWHMFSATFCLYIQCLPYHRGYILYKYIYLSIYLSTYTYTHNLISSSIREINININRQQKSIILNYTEYSRKTIGALVKINFEICLCVWIEKVR